MQQNDFASEYKDLIRADVPDLWSRIEARIDEKANTEKAEDKTESKAVPFVKEETAEVKSGVVTESGAKEAETGVSPAKIRKFRWQPYAGVAAAAAICVVVGIAAMSGTRNAAGTAMAPMSDAAPAAAPASEGASNETDSMTLDTGGAFYSANATNAEKTSEATAQSASAEAEMVEGLVMQEAACVEESEAEEGDEATDSDRPSNASGATAAGDDKPDGGESAKEGIILYDGTEVTNYTLMISVVSGTKTEDVEKLCEKYRMEIGYDHGKNDSYTLHLLQPVHDEAELRKLIEALEKESIIESVSPDGISYPDIE